MKMPGRSIRRFVPPIISVILACGLAAGLIIASRSIPARDPIAIRFLIEIGFLAAAILIVGLIYALQGHRPKYLHRGSLRARARPIKWLGIEDSDTWRKVGQTYGMTIIALTLVLTYLTYQKYIYSANIQSWGLAFLIAVPLALLQSISGNLIFRWSIVETFDPSNRLAKLAPLVAAAISLVLGYFAVVGGYLGGLLAAFTSWIAARSIQETGGLTWAVIVTFLQNLIILTVFLAIVL